LRLSKAGTVLIAIDGPGGAGKSTLAAAIASRFDRAHVVCLDDFAKPTQQVQSLAFTMVSKKVGNCDKRMDDKHANYPPSFCFIGNLFINGRINNHPYFKSENQYSNYNNNWQPCP
jgi:cytidylate kinase